MREEEEGRRIKARQAAFQRQYLVDATEWFISLGLPSMGLFSRHAYHGMATMQWATWGIICDIYGTTMW